MARITSSRPDVSSTVNDLESWRLFLRICEQGSFSKVAESTGMDVSTISRRINRLERALGIQLFSRTTRTLSVTPEGNAIREKMLRVIEGFDDATLGFRQNRTELITLSGPACLNEFLLNRWALQFLTEHPGTQFSLSLTDQPVDPALSGVDVAFHTGIAVVMGENIIRLGEFSSRMCASPAYLREHPAPQTPDDLTSHVLLAYRGKMSSPRTWLIKDGILESFSYKESLQATSTTALVQLALDGSGILLFGCDFMLHNWFQEGRLVEVLSDWKQPHTMVHAVLSERSRSRPIVQKFVQFIKRKWKETPGLFTSA